MTGLVAIITRDRRDPVRQAEIDDLATTYESLRGARGRHSVSAATHARLTVLSTADDGRPPVEHDGASWTASIGVVHHEGSLVGVRPEELEVLQELRAEPRFAKTPVVMLTARAQAVDRDAATAAGADRFLPKPFSPLELVSIVEQLLNGHA